MDIYESIDLTEYGLEGVTMRLLVNPTRKLRRDYIASWTAQDGAWLEHIKRVLDCTDEVIDNLDPLVLHRLCVPHIADDGALIMPVVFAIWDKWVSDRVKSLAAPPAG
jgi:hypothetical protein